MKNDIVCQWNNGIEYQFEWMYVFEDRQTLDFRKKQMPPPSEKSALKNLRLSTRYRYFSSDAPSFAPVVGVFLGLSIGYRQGMRANPAFRNGLAVAGVGHHRCSGKAGNPGGVFHSALDVAIDAFIIYDRISVTAVLLRSNRGIFETTLHRPKGLT